MTVKQLTFRFEERDEFSNLRERVNSMLLPDDARLRRREKVADVVGDDVDLGLKVYRLMNSFTPGMKNQRTRGHNLSQIIDVLYAGRGNLAEAADVVEESLSSGKFSSLIRQAGERIRYEDDVRAGRRYLDFSGTFYPTTMRGLQRELSRRGIRNVKLGGNDVSIWSIRKDGKRALGQAYWRARVEEELHRRAILTPPAG